jgi:hypothetical protein
MQISFQTYQKFINFLLSNINSYIIKNPNLGNDDKLEFLLNLHRVGITVNTHPHLIDKWVEVALRDSLLN